MRTRIPGAVGTLFALDMAVKQYIEENISGRKKSLWDRDSDQKSI